MVGRVGKVVVAKKTVEHRQDKKEARRGDEDKGEEKKK
jgi:hypothetical protein